MELRIFSDGASAPASAKNLSRQLTLSQFFERYLLPEVLHDAAPRNVEQYRESLRLWETATGSPTLEKIGRDQTHLFRDWLAKRQWRGRPIGKNTVRKHCIEVQAVLDRAGPKSRHNDDGAGLIADVPVIKKPGLVMDDQIDNFSLAEIGWWLEACRAADIPRLAGVRAAEWHQALVVFDYNAGPRLGTLLKLRWEWLEHDDRIESEVPGAAAWWLACPASAMKGGKRGQRIYVNRWAWAAISALPRSPTGRIFSWPYTEGYLQAVRRAILARSKIPLNRQFGFHGLRRALGTELGTLHALAAKMSLGHAGRDVTLDFYSNRRILAQHSEKLPQPVWDRERRLF